MAETGFPDKKHRAVVGTSATIQQKDLESLESPRRSTLLEMKEISPTVFKRRKKGKGIGGGEEGKKNSIFLELLGELNQSA